MLRSMLRSIAASQITDRSLELRFDVRGRCPVYSQMLAVIELQKGF
ncbi:MAG: hypothetical protein ACI8XO_003310, partial [Verrucomicrobiales bacterium]